MLEVFSDSIRSIISQPIAKKDDVFDVITKSKVYLKLLIIQASIFADEERPDEANLCFLEAVEYCYQDSELLQLWILAMVQAGHRTIALEVLSFLIKNFPDNFKLHTLLGALYQATNKVSKSRDVIQTFFVMHPIHQSSASRPGLLRIFHSIGMQNTLFKIRYNKHGIAINRSGGHFALKRLMDREDYSFTNYHISRDNINSAPPDKNFDLLLNSIADPDLEKQSLLSLNTYLSQRPDVPVINHPTRVMAISRDENYRRFSQINGIFFPKTHRIMGLSKVPYTIADEIKAEGFEYPFIIREVGTHTGISTELIEDRDALIHYLTDNPSLIYYVIEYIDSKNEAGEYSKFRFFCIDGQLYPVIYHVDKWWNVHGDNRKTFMINRAWALDREKRFLANPASVLGDNAYKLLQSLYSLVKLDFFGIDGTQLADGTILLFELNPSMRHKFNHAEAFPYMTPYLDNVTDAFTNMVNNRAKGC